MAKKTTAKKAAKPATMKIRITKDRLPLGDGTLKVRGQSAELPTEQAEQFIANGWAENAK